jgi:ferredoxin-nitrite reductase
MGDIGLMGVKTGGEEGYHVFVGGGFGKQQAVGRQLYAGVLAKELPLLIARMLKSYLRRREGKETFLAFTTRNEVGKLQEVFAE